jgi:hypothetical protein
LKQRIGSPKPVPFGAGGFENHANEEDTYYKLRICEWLDFNATV